jgi:hypothetical protein
MSDAEAVSAAESSGTVEGTSSHDAAADEAGVEDTAEAGVEDTAEASVEADPVLLASRDLARSALIETTPAHTVGEDAGHIIEAEHVLSLRFASRLEGYIGWFWTVTIARVDDAEPTVLEVSLLPGDGALVAPDWVPWSERLADYRASQEAAAALGEAADDDGEDDADEIDESDLAADDELDIDDPEDASDDDDSDDDDDESDDDESDEDEDDDDDDDSDDDESDDDDDDDSDDDDSDDDSDEEYDERRR